MPRIIHVDSCYMTWVFKISRTAVTVFAVNNLRQTNCVQLWKFLKLNEQLKKLFS